MGTSVSIAVPKQMNTTHNIPCLYSAPVSPSGVEHMTPLFEQFGVVLSLRQTINQVSVLIVPLRTSCKIS